MNLYFICFELDIVCIIPEKEAFSFGLAPKIYTLS